MAAEKAWFWQLAGDPLPTAAPLPSPSEKPPVTKLLPELLFALNQAASAQ